MLFTTLIEKSYKNILKPLFFKKDPEDVHDRMLKFGQILGKITLLNFITKLVFDFNHAKLKQEVDGLTYRNPVGLSAGFDKDANLLKVIHNVGFSFAEIGSVTLHPYEGNPKPRLYRLKKDKGLVVFYGLKNIGVDKIIKKIKKDYKPLTGNVLGISIARTNSAQASGLEEGIDDYTKSLDKIVVAGVGDYYTINISCPNTFYGEPYSTPERLEKLLVSLLKIKIEKPIYLKMPINLPWDKFDLLLETAVKHHISGVIIGNLNKDRNSEYITEKYPEDMRGGVSGIPTRELSNNLIRKTYLKYKDKLTIIGVGGIDSAESAYEKICYGANLVQMITGMIFNGPQLIGQINKGLVELLEKDGYENISEAIGSKV
ncbi:quinone-dependent dihydroorotate dehydrogenase [Candidatus Dojkabacteria bacterium]|uniref:Dihydroorotate dehydrogenase (quinone) n=1 Tax=Candidatus Dojkabacteria bacterium TaxID=2099670 RepID=A0A955I725_9BACT|nr:quinone-dependent dihydroorotate dehydrogenase [Candidatus Dojkabacteria bacterium]